MSVYKPQNTEVYWYDFWLHGERYRGSTKLYNKNDAKDYESSLRTDIIRKARGIGKDQGERRKVGRFIDDLEADYKLRGKGTNKNLLLIKRVKADFGETWADSLTKDDLTGYIERKKKGKRPVANSTLKHALQILKSGFKLAGFPFPQAPKLPEAPARSGFFADDEVRRVITHLPDDLKDFTLFAYLCGWRKGAIASLTWDDVRDVNVYLPAARSKNRRPYFVPLLGEIAEVIERRRKDHGLTNLIFHRSGAPVMQFDKAWASACEAAGCPARLFHDLRRTCARNLRRAGVDESVCMRITGHATSSMFKRYAIVDEEDLKNAMEKVAVLHATEQEKVLAMR